MSTRFAFFEVKGLEDVGVETLTDKLQADRFGTQSSTGFLFDKRSRGSLEARFIEKITLVDTFTDPLGNQYSQERVQFNELHFYLRTTRPQLIIQNGNSAFKAFTGRLLEVSDFGLSITPMVWQPLEVVDRFQSEFKSAVVYVANPYPLNITPAVVVKMTFEGSEDVRRHVKSFSKLRKPKFSGLKFQCVLENRTLKCEVKENGTLALFGDVDPFITERVLAIVDALCREKSKGIGSAH